MRIRINNILLLIFTTVLFTTHVNAQTTQVTDDLLFQSGQQSMWGPNGVNFSMNKEIDLFDIDEEFTLPLGGIANIAGAKFGVLLEATFGFLVNAQFFIEGFSLGTVNVKYPTEATIEYPQDETYDQGDWVTLETEHVVQPDHKIESDFPSAGKIGLDVNLGFAAELSLKFCVFSCATFEILDAELPTFTISIFELDVTGARMLRFGAQSAFLYDFPTPTISTALIPNDPLGNYGFTATLYLPDIQMVDANKYRNGNMIGNVGEAKYVDLTLDLFGLLAGLNIPYVSAVAKVLSGSESIDFGIATATIYWRFLGIDLNFSMNLKQRFEFRPNLQVKFVFSTPVEHRLETSNNAYGSIKVGNTATVDVGKKLQYKYPCNFDEVSVNTTYSISKQGNNFLSDTYDSLHFKLIITVLKFGIKVPPVVLFPGIPEFCVFGLCIGPIAAISTPNIDIQIGPAWEDEFGFPLGNITWNRKEWNLAGFSDTTGTSFVMRASKLTSSMTKTDILCHNDNTGAVNVSVGAKSHATPYLYTWSNGTTQSTTSNSHGLTNLLNGNYQVMIKDANNCTLYNGINVDQPAYPLEVATSKVDKLCGGGVNNGTINSTVSGGTAGYTYAWTKTNDNTFSSSTANLIGLGSGTYGLTVQDNNNCIASTSVVINEPLVLGQEGIITDVNCHGDATGVVDVTAFGGVLPYTYSWTGSTHTLPLFSNRLAGNYSMQVRDANGCTHTRTYTVSQPVAPLALTSQITDVLCKGNKTGAVNMTTTGGTQPYSYIWYSDLGGLIPFQSEDISNQFAGVYNARVTDAKDCIFELTSVIAEPLEYLRTEPVLTHVNCFGDATGVVNPHIAGGTPTYSYAWSNGTNAPVLQNVTAGTHTLQLTDNHGCTETYAYVLTQPDAPLNIVLNPTHVLCHGDATGKVNSVVTGGTTPYTYTWSNNVTIDSIVAVTAGNYQLDIVDDKGCVLSNNVDVIQPLAPLNATSIITAVDCHGNASGEVDMTITGGTTPYAIQWNNTASFVMTEITPLISNLYTDTYTAQIVDAHGCPFTLVNVVSEPAAPLSMTHLIDDVDCYGMSDGAIDISVVGGTLPYNYTWSNAASSEDLSAIPSLNYTVLVTDANNCIITDSFYVPQPEAPLVASLQSVAVKCHGGNDGEISSTVTGGTLPYTYAWSNGVTEPSQLSLTAAVYTLTVTDAKGCTSFTGMLVDQPAQPLVVTPTITDVQCFGGSDGIIDIAATGGVQPYYYSWGNQNEIQLNHFSERISGLNIGNYFLRVYDRNGCVSEQYITMGQPAAPDLQANITNNLCHDDMTGAIDLTATGGTLPYVYTWSNGQTTQDISNIPSGYHEVVIVDAQMCEYRKTFYVDQPQKLQFAYDIKELSCIDQVDAAVIVEAYGGISPYSYNWTNGVSTGENSGLSAGNVDVVITDNNGCISIGNFVIAPTSKECLFIPNTFTPNNDNYNDTWFIENLDLYPNAHVVVFNKWGNLLFESKGNYTPWDGKSFGDGLPSDVYYYIIRLGNAQNNEYKGTVTIVR